MEEQYTKRLEKIEDALNRLMPETTDHSWINLAAGGDASLKDPSAGGKFLLPGRDLLLRGGKRWRPLVMALCYEAAGGSGDVILELTPLVEVAHNGSLIIDDLEDRSDERRGAPAVHKIYGEDLSINAGNLMYFLPTALIETAPFSDAMKLRFYQIFNQDLRRLHLGQGLDILWHNDHTTLPDVEDYLQMCRFKTGSLARMSGRLGVAAAGGDEKEDLETAKIFEDMGVGFQILDDVKNLTTGNPGKNRGDDIVEGKKSLPVILYGSGNDQALTRLEPLFQTAASLGVDRGQDAVEEAITLIEESGSLAEAGAIGRNLLNASRRGIEALFPGSPKETALLTGLIDSFLTKML